MRNNRRLVSKFYGLIGNEQASKLYGGAKTEKENQEELS